MAFSMWKKNVAIRPKTQVSSFRKIAIGTWSDPRDPQIYGSLTVRMERALDYIEDYRRATGRRLTVTHLVGKAVARALAETPDANALLRFGRPYLRDQVSVFFSVALEDPETGEIDLSGAKLDDVDQMSLGDIVDAFETEVNRVRTGTDEDLKKSRDTFAWLPFSSVRWVLDAISFGLYDLNADLTALGLPKDPFGSVVVTNIGSLGLTEAYAPLMAYSRTPLLLAVGAVTDEAVVEDGEIVPGKRMRIHATLDHRLLDGKHAAKLSKIIRETLEDPYTHLDAVTAPSLTEAAA
jgi:pyruvate dehydrogenase E2 component (dihydrolipoamide acetyltransferase)